jgi:hypothetical protein
MTNHRDTLLAVAQKALKGEIEDINVKADGSLRLLSAGKELMWTGYSPEAEYLKGLIVRVDTEGQVIDLVAGCLAKFYNYTERAENDAKFMAAMKTSGARTYFLGKQDGSNLRPYVNPDSGQVQWATRGMLEAGMGNSTFGDFAAMAREVATELYPALLDAALVSRYTFICELIYPSNRIVTNYGERRDLPVITVIDLASGQELSRREVVALCEQYKLATVEALKPKSGDFDEAISELRAAWAGTDLEGVVIAVEVPGRPYPYRIKVKGEHYLALMRLIHYCTLNRTREIVESHNLGDLPSFLAYLKAENPDLPEEVRMAYEEHFLHYIAWENENRAEIERLIGVYWAHPLAGTPDRKSFALSIADHPDRWALFMIRDSGPEAARMRMLPLVRRQREKLLKVGEAGSLEDRLALAG